MLRDTELKFQAQGNAPMNALMSLVPFVLVFLVFLFWVEFYRLIDTLCFDTNNSHLGLFKKAHIQNNKGQVRHL